MRQRCRESGDDECDAARDASVLAGGRTARKPNALGDDDPVRESPRGGALPGMNRIRTLTLGLGLVAAACTTTHDGGSIVGETGTSDDGPSSETAAPDTSNEDDGSTAADDGSSGDAAQSCRGASEGAGIAYVGQPEPGVRCEDEVCGLGCEFNFDAHCEQPTSGTDHGIDVACDGPEDCDGADVCCQRETGTFDRAAECVTADACDEFGARVCNTDADCDGGACVRAWSNQAALDLGVCQAGPASSCTATPGADCSGADLRGADFIALDLAGVDFCQADLSNARLDAADLSGTVLAGADLSGATLRDTALAGADLRGADLTDADVSSLTIPADATTDVILVRATFIAVVLDGCDLRGIDLQGAFIYDTSLRQADLAGANLRDATLSGVDLTGADLTGAVLDGVILTSGTCPDGTPATSVEGTLNGCEGHLE